MNIFSIIGHPTLIRIVAVAYLAGMIVFGGASNAGVLPNLVIQAAAPLVLMFLLWRRERLVLTKRQKVIVALFVACLLIAVLQLAPLPPEIWVLAPGRTPVKEGFELLGVALPAMPISFTPLETASGLFRFLPPLTAFLLVTQLVAEEKKIGIAVPATIAALGVVSALVGLSQAVGPKDAPLYFYAFTNRGSGVGFFANANHYASFLLMCLPFVATTAAQVIRHRTDRQVGAAVSILTAGAVLTLLMGVVAAGSLFGYLMAGPVAVASLFIFQIGRRRTAPGDGFAFRPIAYVGLAVVLCAVGYMFGTSSFLSELGVVAVGQEGELARPKIFARTFLAIKDTFPFGSGLGSFQSLYPLYEDQEAVTSTFVNHAHNDYLEFVLEFGVFGGVLIFVALILWFGTAVRLWSRMSEPGDGFRRAASVAVLIVIVHSVVDYPLRTAASAGVAAAAAGLMTASHRKARAATGASKLGGRRLTL